MRIFLRILIPVVVLGAGYLGMLFLLKDSDKPVAKVSAERPKRPAQRAKIIPLERVPYPIVIRTRGVVQAHNPTNLTARVSGRIDTLHPNFEPGAFFRRGDVLVELDPTDTEAAIISAEAAVARAEAALAQEEARAKQAQLNWNDLGYTDKPNDLVLRIPQLREAEANLKTAEAQLAEARRNKIYTKITAPFDGCVRERLVGPGQTVSPNTALGEIFATDYAEVRLPVSPKDLPFTPFQYSSDLKNTPATIHNNLGEALEEEQSWEAKLVRTEAVIDETSRELFLIARIPDPYGLKSGHPPLRIGQPILAEVPGNTLEDVFVIPRETLRGPFETVLVDNETMKIERFTVEPVWSDAENLVIEHELPPNHSIVATRIPYAANGAVIEAIEDEPEEVSPVESAHAQTPPAGA
ncbi:MAG: efflux RND transporter periplasmic adaptor subunit [Verrucomicrobiota bacterium JB023]|nr:efflux RND transporter periplasmic adaptor subunit [Verrucomicrobiota bacterium JB023]